MRRLAAAIFVLSLAACATSGDSPYNKGVYAFRAKNYAEARLQWQVSLAEGGPNETFNNLGFLLYYGIGGPQDKSKAVELWRKGAALAVSEAQFHLGQAYEEGAAVPRSISQAYAWYKCAQATASHLSGDELTEREIESMAAKAVARLSSKLSAAELTEGESLAKDLVAKYAVPLRAGEP